MSDLTRRGLFAMLAGVAAAPVAALTAAPQGHRDENGNFFLKNSILVKRDGDGPLFTLDYDKGTLQPRIDSYVIIPIERYGEELK